jgi:hypothetical protein
LMRWLIAEGAVERHDVGVALVWRWCDVGVALVWHWCDDATPSDCTTNVEHELADFPPMWLNSQYSCFDNSLCAHCSCLGSNGVDRNAVASTSAVFTLQLL